MRRGALPKKNQKYLIHLILIFITIVPYQDIDKFDPQMDSSVGAYGDTMTRGATYFTSE